MRTRKHSSPMETVWMDKRVYDEAEHLPYGRAAEQLVAGQLQEVEQVGTLDSDLPSERCRKNDQMLPRNSRKPKRRRRSPKNKGSSPKLEGVLNGPVLERVWFDKYMYEEAESMHQAKLSADQAKMLKETQLLGGTSTLVPSQAVDPWKINRMTGQVAVTCPHNNSVACHHVVYDAWVNKVNFDKAESTFVERFGSLSAPRPLDLHIEIGTVHHGFPLHCTPDEGYVTTVSTPATPDLPVSPWIAPRQHAECPDNETVNGKPQWSGMQELIAEVWLEKALYDHAERRFYETTSAGGSPFPLKEQCKGCKTDSAKNQRSLNASRKAKTKAGEVSLSQGACLTPHFGYAVHPDSERAWFDKSVYDEAESQYHTSLAYNMSSSSINDWHLTPKHPSMPAAILPTARALNTIKMAAESLLYDKVWFDKPKYDDAERQYYEQLSGTSPVSPLQKTPVSPSKRVSTPKCKNSPVSACQEEDGASTILRDIARARENIQKSLAGSAAASAGSAGEPSELVTRVANLELENHSLHKVVEDLQLALSKLEVRLTTLEKAPTLHPPTAAQPAAAPTPNAQPTAPVKKVEVISAPEEDDDDIDLFGSDEEEDEEAERIREERLRQYAEKKSKKPGIIAKSSILLDVKPWDDETDMAKLEECVRTVQMDGLLWGASKLVPVGYGIRKLQIQCVVEDDKVGTDILEEEITKFEDYVQSVDIAAFNKI